jgi:hypothetical protein
VAVAVIAAIVLGGVALALRSRSSGPAPTVFPRKIDTATPSVQPSASPIASDWPTYGYDRARTHFSPDVQLRPPFRVKWKYDAGDLLEFPGIVDGRLLSTMQRRALLG